MENPGSTPTALDAVQSRINFVDPPGHVCETSIRLAPDDDRVIWLLTAYDKTTVIGTFAALPDEEEGTVQEAVQDQARAAYAMTALADPELIARAERINAAIAERVNREFLAARGL